MRSIGNMGGPERISALFVLHGVGAAGVVITRIGHGNINGSRDDESAVTLPDIVIIAAKHRMPASETALRGGEAAQPR